jgi:hypothetical protein
VCPSIDADLRRAAAREQNYYDVEYRDGCGYFCE